MITKYITYLRSLRGLSENTAMAYERDLRDFATWARANIADARWSLITREDVDRYIIELAAAGLKPATTNRRLSAIAGFYGYLRREGKSVENPCKYESRRKIAKTIPNTIPEDDLIAAYKRSVGATKVMLGLLIGTGIRIQELLDMEYSDINFNEGCIKIHGKGRKERVVYVQHNYLETLQMASQLYNGVGRIFSIDQRQARWMVYQALQGVSQARQLSPHAIRHTLATHYAKAGANVTTLATIMGHDDIRTTQKYIDMTAIDVKDTMAQYTIINN